MNQYRKEQLLARLGRVFSPGAPIDQRDLFAGRIEQIERIADAVGSRGQHAVVFGERGVGKTSLANMLKEVFANEPSIVVKVNCDQDDNFDTVWRKSLSEIEFEEQGDSLVGFHPRRRIRGKTLADDLPERAGPDDIRRALQPVGDAIIIFDEFDRLHDLRARRLFADTIKNLSDNLVRTTLVLVGVADDVDGLIEEHASIDRALAQIQMPRMTDDELKEIISKALHTIKMTIRQEAVDLIVLLSQGLPHYTHLLGLHSARSSLLGGRLRITIDDVHAGIKSALEQTQQSIRNVYQKAVASNRKDTLFREVLLACALADVDESGYFVSAAVREPLSKIMGKPYEIPGFSQHLDKFSSSGRGPVLEKAGTTRRFRFRFMNPLLQPYVIMRGLSDGMINGELLKLLERKRRP